MSALILLIGFSLLIASGFLFAFFWAVKDGQYEDDYTPSVRMLFDGNSQTPPEVSQDPATTLSPLNGKHNSHHDTELQP